MEDSSLSDQMLINVQAVMQPIASFIEYAGKAVARYMGNVRKRLLYMRKHGTRQEKRLAWKILHPARRRKISSRRRR
jgi:hypothetical protein